MADTKWNVPSETEQQDIHARIKSAVPEEIYDNWIEDFVFERIDSEKVVVSYHGKSSLKAFKKEYKDIVWMHLCAALGYSEKFVIRKGRSKKVSTVAENPKVKKQMKTAKLVAISMAFALIALSFVLVMCNYITNRNFRETFYSASSLKINERIRVLQISDLHSCTYGKENEKLLARVEKLAPDLIVLSGDILDKDKARLTALVNFCSHLTKIAPTYYIYGNNEAEYVYNFPLSRDGIDGKFGFTEENREADSLLRLEDSLEMNLEGRGVRVLKNEKAYLKVGTTEIDIFGVLTSNPSSFYPYAGASYNSYLYENPNRLKITIAHEPTVFETFTGADFGDLILCGHTHGGTVRIPVLGPFYTHEGGFLPERGGAFVYGRYDVSGTRVIVSGGMENNNLLRINNQPELVVVDINKF